MIDRLFHAVQKPALWQRSAAAFWDDAHISKGMLDAHLIPDRDTAYTLSRLTDEISPFGFKVSGVFNDVCGSPHTGESDTLCVVLERGAK